MNSLEIAEYFFVLTEPKYVNFTAIVSATTEGKVVIKLSR